MNKGNLQRNTSKKGTSNEGWVELPPKFLALHFTPQFIAHHLTSHGVTVLVQKVKLIQREEADLILQSLGEG